MTKAIILSGGKGTRLMPLTKNTPKPMLPIDGTPHLEYTIELLKKHGITDIIFSTGYLHEHIHNYFGNGEAFGVHIAYREDGDKELGTAGAIKNCEDLLDDEPFLVVNGDILTNIDLSGMMNSHLDSTVSSLLTRGERRGITLALAEVSNPSQFGLAVLKNYKDISHFIEKPDKKFLDSHPNLPYLINAGIYVMDREVLEDVPANQFYMVEKDLFPIYAVEEGLYSHVERHAYWLDIGTHDRYALAIKDVVSGKFAV